MGPERADDRIRIERQRCPFCHDDVRPEHDKAACDGCMAWQHAECWRAHGACAACGFAGPPAAPVAPERAALKLVAEKPPVDGRPECARAGCGCAARPGFRTCAAHDAREGATLFLVIGVANLALFVGLYGGLLKSKPDDAQLMLILGLVFGLPAVLFGAWRHLRAWGERV